MSAAMRAISETIGGDSLLSPLINSQMTIFRQIMAESIVFLHRFVSWKLVVWLELHELYMSWNLINYLE
jgi:hypothetical protein